MVTDRRTLWGSLAVLLLLFGGYVQQERHTLGGDEWKRGLGGDFHPYYVGGKVARGDGGGKLYYPPTQGNPVAGFVDPDTPWGKVARASGVPGTSLLIYPPFFALLMKPFAYLPVKWAFVLWREINTLFVVLSILLAVIHLRAVPRMPVFVMALAGALASFPFQEAMFLGQVGGLVLLLWTVGVWAADSKRPILSAFCFALGTMVKVTPLLVVPLFLLRKQWKWLIAYTSWMALFLGVGIWQLGWANHVTYFSRVLPAMSSGFPNSRNKSLFTIIQSLYFGDAFYQLESSAVSIPFGLTLLGKALSLTLFCGVLIYFYKQSKAATRIAHEITALAVLSLLISPVTWRHHYVLMILPLLYLWLDAKGVALSDRSYVVLLLSTVAVASIFPFYLLELVHNSVLQIAVSAVMPAGAVALLAMSLVQYSRSKPMVDAEESGPEMRRPAEASALMAAQ